MSLTTSPRLRVTKNYRAFDRSTDNRPLIPTKHKHLRRSMEKYGFLPCYPVVCIEDKKKLVVLDGQHRLSFAETLGLAVWYVVVHQGFDIAQVNSTQEKWNTRNFAETYAAQGKRPYQEGLEFADKFGIPVGVAFGLLAGTASWNNIRTEYLGGSFRIKDRGWADTVGTIYSKIVETSPRVRNARLLEACMAVGRVEGFDPQRLLSGAERCREKLVPYSTRDAYLDMLEEVYNFGRHKLSPIKMAAIQAMRDRNVVNGAKKK